MEMENIKLRKTIQRLELANKAGFMQETERVGSERLQEQLCKLEKKFDELTIPIKSLVIYSS